jgi:N-acetylglucosamine repressor
VTITDLFKVAESKDPYAMEVLEEIASYFALGINNVIMINDPELIVIQGIYIEAGQYFLDSLKKRVMHLAYPYLKRDLELVFTSFKEERGAVGAGSFGVYQYFENSELYY